MKEVLFGFLGCTNGFNLPLFKYRSFQFQFIPRNGSLHQKRKDGQGAGRAHSL